MDYYVELIDSSPAYASSSSRLKTIDFPLSLSIH